jgi:hypothetical protein
LILLPHFTRALLVRSLLTWTFVRTLTTAGSAALRGTLRLPQPPHSLLLSPTAALAVVAVCAVTGWVYARRANEDVFLLGLGYGRARLVGTLVLPPLLLEVALGAATRA